MLPMLVIGGGIHGTIISYALARYFNVDYHRVLDPHTEPLSLWNRNCMACGMQFLRSPAAHNLTPHALSLLRYAKKKNIPREHNFIPRYSRPRYSLFQEYSADLIKTHALHQFRLLGSAITLNHTPQSVRVETDNGILEARRVILAIGTTSLLNIPEWAEPHYRHASHRCDHIYSDTFSLRNYRQKRRIAIIGGGLSAAQLALTLCTANSTDRNPIYIIARHALRHADFDSDPCFIGPACLRQYNRESRAQKKIILDRGRNIGTIPPNVMDALQRAIQNNTIKVLTDAVTALAPLRKSADTMSSYTLQFRSAQTLEIDALILATGFQQTALRSTFLQNVLHENRLAVDDDRFPITDQQLRWNRHIFVSGGLALLTNGPAAANIIGAQMSLRRILPTLKEIPYRDYFSWKPLRTVMGDVDC